MNRIFGRRLGIRTARVNLPRSKKIKEGPA